MVMKLKFYQQKGFVATLIVAIILIVIPIVTDVYEELFVPETGHFKIMGGLTIIIAIGLLAKWKFFWHAAGILSVIILLLAIGMAFVMGMNYAMAYVGLIITLIGLLILLQSKPVRIYMGTK